MMSNEPPEASTPSPGSKRQAPKKKLVAAAKNVKTVAGKVGQQLQKVNIAKWIDDLELDQEVADRMERINANNQEEQKHRDMKREATEACFDAIQSHLDDFLQTHPTASYEKWIEDLHPDNVLEKGGETVIDHRFYVDDSDHRHIWNRNLRDRERNITRRYVPASSILSLEGSFSSTDGIPTNGESNDSTF
jgi:hypothetical protein